MYYIVVNTIDDCRDKIFYILGPISKDKISEHIENVVYHETHRTNKFVNKAIEREYDVYGNLPDFVFIYGDYKELNNSGELQKEETIELARIYIYNVIKRKEDIEKKWNNVMDELIDCFN